uniref:Uncharacterized protein n=1 Tax=Octopus bimaculoides TaxID=37653 RepID=A0A0L8GRI7_OCTBM
MYGRRTIRRQIVGRIYATAKCEVRAVIRFLNAKGIKPIEIHRQLTEVCGEKCRNIKNARK